MAVRSLGDLVRGPPPEDAYIQLKARLLTAHTLTEFQRMEKLLAAQALGGQKPSDMLHDLVQFCPDGEAQTKRSGSSWLRTGTPSWLPWQPVLTSCGLTAPGSRSTPPSTRFWKRRETRP